MYLLIDYGNTLWITIIDFKQLQLWVDLLT